MRRGPRRLAARARATPVLEPAGAISARSTPLLVPVPPREVARDEPRFPRRLRARRRISQREPAPKPGRLRTLRVEAKRSVASSVGRSSAPPRLVTLNEPHWKVLYIVMYKRASCQYPDLHVSWSAQPPGAFGLWRPQVCVF